MPVAIMPKETDGIVQVKIMPISVSTVVKDISVMRSFQIILLVTGISLIFNQFSSLYSNFFLPLPSLGNKCFEALNVYFLFSSTVSYKPPLNQSFSVSSVSHRQQAHWNGSVPQCIGRLVLSIVLFFSFILICVLACNTGPTGQITIRLAYMDGRLNVVLASTGLKSATRVND